MKTKPSDFKVYPWGSVFQRSEHETIALNIITILSRTGDAFRDLSWEEYKEERLKDSGFSDQEKSYFDSVWKYCKSADTAKLFSPYWADK